MSTWLAFALGSYLTGIPFTLVVYSAGWEFIGKPRGDEKPDWAVIALCVVIWPLMVVACYLPDPGRLAPAAGGEGPWLR